MSTKSAGGSALRGMRSVNWRPWAVVCVVLVVCGAGYRLTMAKIDPLMKERVVLPIPLSTFPMTVGSWVGEDKPLSKEVEKVAGNDDYIYRIYLDSKSGDGVHFYIAYSGNPPTMVGHRPQTCYVGAGWTHESTSEDITRLAGGGTLPCLVHHFHQPPPKTGDMVVLNYYVLNGVPTNNESDFTGITWRLPNINGDPARYVAQIQISSPSEAAVKAFAALSADAVLAQLPDPAGTVRASASREASKAGAEGK